MASRREQILDAMAAALSGATATDLSTGATYTKPPCTIYRTRPAALKAGDLPAIVVRAVREEPQKGAGGHKARRLLTVAVHCLVGAASAGATVESALDALTSWSVQAVMNAASLRGGTGSLANDTSEALTEWDETDADAVYGRAAIGFQLDYITAAGNPDAA